MKQSSRTILLVEDDDDIRESLQMILEYEGFEVHTAAHGRDALERLHGKPAPDSGAPRPHDAGDERRRAARRDPRDHQLEDLPVVILSAWSRKAAATPNAQGFLRKPVDIDALLEVAHRLTG